MKERGSISFSNFEENELKFEFDNLALIAEKYLSANKKV